VISPAAAARAEKEKRALAGGGGSGRPAGKRKAGGGPAAGGIGLLLEAASALSKDPGEAPVEGTASAGSSGACEAAPAPHAADDTALSPTPDAAKRARHSYSRPAAPPPGPPELPPPPPAAPRSPPGSRDLCLMRGQLAQLRDAFGEASPVLARAVAEYAHAAHVRGEALEADGALGKAWEVYQAGRHGGSLLDVRAGFERMLEEIAHVHLVQAGAAPTGLAAQGPELALAC